ncbi:MAG: DHH family phosphoesterase [Spirochaetaceae bacterium]|nr:MAG: DHH family phosphoesterase [Spirochaetaceae bacterium]
MVVVIGSSAADLDSIAGSLAYAYLLDREAALSGPVIPYLPVPRGDLPLRPEAVYLFERVGLRWENLLFADDIVLGNLLSARQGELVLVDTQDSDLATDLRMRVIEVIDHHAEAPVPPPSGTGRPPHLRRWIVEPTGSACTIVAEQIVKRKPDILDPELATLLLAVVLLDTINLDTKAGRATERDREIARWLTRIGSADKSALYEGLVRERSNIEGLDSDQLLRKDYKEREVGSVRIGMSSVPILLESWRQRDLLFEEGLTSYLAGKALDLLVVLLYLDGKQFRRQLILCSADARMLERVVSRLAKPLGLSEIPAQIGGPKGPGKPRPAKDRRVIIRSFDQGVTVASRKRIEPLLLQVLTAHEK